MEIYWTDKAKQSTKLIIVIVKCCMIHPQFVIFAHICSQLREFYYWIWVIKGFKQKVKICGDSLIKPENKF